MAIKLPIKNAADLVPRGNPVKPVENIAIRAVLAMIGIRFLSRDSFLCLCTMTRAAKQQKTKNIFIPKPNMRPDEYRV